MHKQDKIKYTLGRCVKSPKFFYNYLASIFSHKLKLEKPLCEPIYVDIEPINQCNFRCDHCLVTHSNWEKKVLSQEKLKNILSHFHYPVRIKLQGIGEPFLNKSIVEMAKYVIDEGFWLEMTTNGSVMNQSVMESIQKLKNFDLTVSLDAGTKEIFEKIRIGSNFDLIKSNLMEYGHNFNAWMVVTNENQMDIENVFSLVKDANLKRIGFQFNITSFGSEHMYDKTQMKSISSDNLRPFIEKMSKKYKVRYCISDTFFTNKNICFWPWKGVFLDVNGNIVPCCVIADANVINMGNILEKNFIDIWNSKKYRNFRKMHANNEIPEFCKGCYK